MSAPNLHWQERDGAIWQPIGEQWSAFCHGASLYQCTVMPNPDGGYQVALTFGSVLRATSTPEAARAWCLEQIERLEAAEADPMPVQEAIDREQDREGQWFAEYRAGERLYYVDVLKTGELYSPLVLLPGNRTFATVEEAQAACMALVERVEQLTA